MVRSTAAVRRPALLRTRAFALFATVWLVAATLLALPRPATAQDVDPPGRAARLSEATGRVWLFANDANEWLEVGRNRPLATGDRIATDDDTYAEVTLGTTVLRVAPATELEIATLDDRAFAVHLHGGSLAARLKTPEAASAFTLSTDEGRFVVRTAGHYRFDRFERTSDVTVIAGQATFENRANALAVNAGQHAQFWLDGRGAPQYALAEPARDAFAGWAVERDRADLRLASSQASRYVSPEMVG
ncbi:MAG TPA: FecR domain-containing protein, partial [Geminicoccaceae bacterium]